MTDLAGLIAAMRPEPQPGEYVFVPDPSGAEVPAGLTPVATVREPEGLTLVLPREEAAVVGLAGAFSCGWITLRVRSELDAVGLTAAVATALATDDIACNVVAGFHHDHLFVPIDRVHDAVAALRALAHVRPSRDRRAGP